MSDDLTNLHNRIAGELVRGIVRPVTEAGAWDKNPWIAAYTFTVLQQNIDAMPASLSAEVRHGA